MECTKDELEDHLAKMYSDPRRDKELPLFAGLKRPKQPGVQFNLGDLKKKDIDKSIY